MSPRAGLRHISDIPSKPKGEKSQSSIPGRNILNFVVTCTSNKVTLHCGVQVQLVSLLGAFTGAAKDVASKANQLQSPGGDLVRRTNN